ncbi:hypothetical protein [Blastococcus tunisiensis]|uniref:hypothetical protein n=1 Tax=Blastococcus tunisiensis TaxID=1798228 RepID=UPI0020C86E09|nr:hypothetical protein [Blastococcus sp. DSM 46838]
MDDRPRQPAEVAVLEELLADVLAAGAEEELSFDDDDDFSFDDELSFDEDEPFEEEPSDDEAALRLSFR